jgi:hypothetical protein
VPLWKEGLKSLVLSSQEVPVDGIFYVEDLEDTMLRKNSIKGVQLGDTTSFPRTRYDF